MMTPASHAKQAVQEAIRKFPNVGHRTLARKLYKAHPALWPTLDACQTMIRRLRGKQGQQNRNRTDTELYETRERSPIAFPKLPEPRKYIAEWEARRCDGANRWLVMSDIHLPFHDLTAIRATWTEAQRRNVTAVLLNGDVPDFYKISRWQTDPRERDFAGEIKSLQQFLAATREAFPKARIIWKLGNHCERWEAYLMAKAPELLDIPEFQLAEISGARKQGIEIIGNAQPILLGKLWTLHGHEYRFSISNPVNPARGLFLRAKISALCGHFHQSSQHAEKDLSGHVVSCWSAGCLCDMRPIYMPLNKWNHGAAFVDVADDGAFEVTNYRIFAGKLYA